MRNQVIKQERGDSSMDVALKALGKSIARWADRPDRFITAIPGLSLFLRDEPTGPMSGMYEPSICLIALTGDPAPQLHEAVTEAGADAVLLKGDLVDSLVHRLHAVRAAQERR